MNPPARVEIEAAMRRLRVSELETEPETLAEVDEQMALLGRGPGLGSVEVLRLALSFEREFNIRIPDADLTVELVSSLGALTAYVAQKLTLACDASG